MTDQVNSDQAASEQRVRYVDLFDAAIRPHGELFRAAAGVRHSDRVLDVGCGTGQSTRDAARAAAAGSALGVDLSEPALEYARRCSADADLTNVTYQQADAQVHRFPLAHFDRCISRFGTMFFADPVAAFTNIGRALRPGARVALLVWQDRERNEWSSAVHQALADGPIPSATGQHPFSLGDPVVAEDILKAAGFGDVSFTDVHEPFCYGPDIDTAYEFVQVLRGTQDLLADLDPSVIGPALDRLRATITSHDTGSGVFFDSSAWIITARRH